MKHESAQALEAAPLDPSSEGTWLVKTRSGIHTCTLDELDLAFQRGQIDASTPVFTAGMTEWQTLGVMADLEAPAANDTAANDTTTNDTANAATPEPSRPRSAAPPPRNLPPPPLRNLPPPLPRNLPPPPASAVAPPPRRLPPPPLADGKSFPPTTTAVFGNGASVWTTPPAPDLQTGVRRNAARVPFAMRRGVGSVLDFASNFMAHLRAVHPRWAAVGPWLFGAGLSGIFVFALYALANAPAGPGVHTRSGPAVSYAAASATVSSAAPSAREPAAASAAAPSATVSNGDVARPPPSSRAAASEPVATTRAASIANDDRAGADEGSDVLRTRDLKLASSRSERQATSSGRTKAKGKAWSKRSKARAARKARRSERAQAFAE